MGKRDAVIDVSNVCRSGKLPPLGPDEPAVWGRLKLVMDAWRNQYGQRARLVLVADSSLSRHLDTPADTKAFDQAVRAGEVTVVDDADPVILGRARDDDLHVISGDLYKEFRREHRWIDTSPGRFHSWETENEQVRIISAGIRPLSDSEVSEADEKKKLKRRSIDPLNPRSSAVLENYWSCANPQCRASKNPRGHLLELPMITSREEPCCPRCRGELMMLSKRKKAHGIVVANAATGEEIMRFPLEAGRPVIVGRGGSGTAANTVTLWADEDKLPHEALLKVSRQHLLLRIEEPSRGQRRLRVTDLGSGASTKVRHRTTRLARRLGAAKEIPAGGEAVVAEGGRVLLADVVTLRLSGRKYQFRRSFKAARVPRSARSLQDESTIF